MADRTPTPPATTEPAPAATKHQSPGSLPGRLKERRKLRKARREDAVKRRRAAAEYRQALRDVDETARAAEHERAERAADRAEQTKIGSVFRHARVNGARARLAFQISQSAEARRLRVQAVRTWTLRVGIPVLLGFGLWSTSGVHDGVVTALALTPGTLSWWAAWVVEPGLITVVAAVIIGRSILRTAGGDVDRRALVVMGAALLVSLALSVLPVWPTVWGADAAAAIVAKSLGPIGAAVTAHLIGMFDDYARDAQPEEGAETLDEMKLVHPVPAGTVPPLPAQKDSPQVPAPAPAAEVTPAPAPAVEAPVLENLKDWEPSADQEEYVDPWERFGTDAKKTAPAAEDNVEPWDEDPFENRPAPTPGARTSLIVPEPAAAKTLLDTWVIPTLPVDERGRQIAPKPGEPAFQAAVDLYLDSERTGEPLSGRKLCELNGVNKDNRLWRQAVIRKAKETQAAGTDTTAPAALF
ncbi:hypothetical protein Q8791_23275 [Nocardiopsis sp. CT-R113]|uniref:Uncharacterized protein n=1 Tax=Nocardiopsis codii TaxID=3065942 RepID=A0ABU7KD26_9ACTN|nr:hypothetical protein [Nocardiopsis sp. CT-R113]MEE2040143.1 hypothetical protein [Nocardiopsis sp. CT-R113]